MTSASTTPPTSTTRRRALSLDNRFLAPVLITGILFAGHLSFGVLESLPRTLLAIVTSILAEMVFGRLMLGKWPHLASAYITGISVGILVRSPAYWPYVMCSLISIASKYAIRWRGRHIWNPSNLGISAMLFLAPATVASLSVQWGNDIWPMLVIWALGAAIIARLRRFHICAAYVASFLAFSGARSLVTGDPFLAAVAPITGPMYQLFIFFMITDPKTTVRSRRGQVVTVFFVALVEALLRLNRVVNAPFYALFLVGPIPFVYELWRDGRRERTESRTAEMEDAPAASSAPHASVLAPSEQPA